MTRTALELVPRDAIHLNNELTLIKDKFPAIDVINIPDLLRYELRSWQGCSYARPYYNNLIPHIRSIDINLDEPLPMACFLKEHNINEVLVITGDPPQDMSHKIYPSTAIDVISKFKKEIPDIKVYAGIDQYRQSIRQEVEYVKRKLNAGADGFFTQPFFDLRLMDMYTELLAGQEVFWGVSPVTSDKSANYWETKNNAVFPASFEPTLEWNVKFARQVLEVVKNTNTNIYFMPIRIAVEKYLSGIFA